ncbi:MAG TPA: BTAD domain-containing putative transcriptional regulator [Streptosporangiaceae bacterium]|nr:BTAD domain-containing putative transcriptional regulator [Streptosporangiaceae bacterium]
MPEEMEFCLLGPLVVRSDGTDRPVPHAKQRAILAGLLFGASRAVLKDELAQILWGAEPPPSAETTIRNYIRRLRDALGETGRARITTVPGGYLLRVDPGELDVDRFESLLRAAQGAARDGTWEQAAGQARAALALWRGEPLQDVPSDVLALREVPRLTELRLQALETRIDADLQLGRHADVVAELQGLVQAHPLREHLQALLMLGLYRSGRQAEALVAYRQARLTLIEEIGTEPGQELSELHQQILSADPALAQPGPEPEPDSAPAPRPARRTITPRELPGPVPHFVGRESALAALTALLPTDVDTKTPEAVVISAIGGTAGVGKTALAVHWAHRVAARFPDGQLYVNLRGFDPGLAPVPPGDAIQGFLEALGVPADQQPAGLEARRGLYRSQLASRRMLILLDNARDTAQVRPLLPGGTGNLVLVTSRHQLTGLVAAEAAAPITLDVLTDAEAREMLRGRLGSLRIKAEPAAVTKLIEVSALLPLALSIVAARAAQRPWSPLAALATELEESTLDGFDAGDGVTSVRTALSWSYQQLPDTAARLFRLLSVHPGPDISVPAAASLTGLPEAGARQALGELSQAHLVAEPAAGRFAFHDLLRAYAAELAASAENEADRNAARHRTLDHYLHTAYAATLALYPARDKLPVPDPQPGVGPEPLADSRVASAWLSAEYQVILAVIGQAAETGFDLYAQQLPEMLATYLDRTGRWQDSVTVQQVFLAAAERRHDRPAQARALRFIGRSLVRLDHYAEGYGYIRQAMELFREQGDRLGQARCHLAMAQEVGYQGDMAEALAHCEQALELFRSIGHRAGEVAALNDVALFHGEMGAYQQAVEYCELAVDLHRELANRDGEAITWGALGRAYRGLGRIDDAITCFRRGLALMVELGQAYNQSCLLIDLGDAYETVGDAAAARQHWRQALGLLEGLDHPDAEEVRARLSGTSYRPSSL